MPVDATNNKSGEHGISFPLRLLIKVRGLLPSSGSLKDCESISESVLHAVGRMNILPVFFDAAKKYPRYREFLARAGVHPKEIVTLEEFAKRVPTMSKQDIFPPPGSASNEGSDRLADMSSVIISSGTSSHFSYSILTKHDEREQRKMVDMMFDYFFDAKHLRPLVINALPMGVTFASGYPLASVGVRYDSAVEIIRVLQTRVGQYIILTDPHIAKNIIEEGARKGIAWETLRASFVVGGSWAPNSLIVYLLSQLSANRETKNSISQTMGLSEIGLNIFFAPPELTLARAHVAANPDLAEHLFGTAVYATPSLMYYVPTRHFVEILDQDECGVGEIVITDLRQQNLQPIVRYRTGDRGKLISRESLEEKLKKSGFQTPMKLQLPLIAIYGRQNKNTHLCDPRDVEEAIYRVPGVPQQLTGHFVLGIEEGVSHVELQMKHGTGSGADLAANVCRELKVFTGTHVAVRSVPYENYRHNMELD